MHGSRDARAVRTASAPWAAVIRSFAFLRKEVVEIVRQPRLIVMLVAGPFALLLMFGYGYSEEAVQKRTIFVGPPELDVRGGARQLRGGAQRLHRLPGHGGHRRGGPGRARGRHRRRGGDLPRRPRGRGAAGRARRHRGDPRRDRPAAGGRRRGGRPARGAGGQRDRPHVGGDRRPGGPVRRW